MPKLNNRAADKLFKLKGFKNQTKIVKYYNHSGTTSKPVRKNKRMILAKPWAYV